MFFPITRRPGETPHAVCVREFRGLGDLVDVDVIDAPDRDEDVWLAAFRKDGAITAAVIWVQTVEGTVLAKVTEEALGPTVLGTPRIVGLLTPTQSDEAAQWRGASLAGRWG